LGVILDKNLKLI